MLWSEKLNNIQKILIKLHNLEKLESSEVLFCNLLIDANEVNRDADMSETEKKNLIINTLLEEKRNLLIHNKQFGLIHRNDPKAGFGSYVFTIVRDIYTCLMDNRIPIIDLDSCKTPFDKMDEGKNRWDSFFKQPWICDKIITLNLQSPSMLAIFPLQDWLSINGSLRRADPREELINIPANPRHYWRYRMHLTVEELLDAAEFNDYVRNKIRSTGR